MPLVRPWWLLGLPVHPSCTLITLPGGYVPWSFQTQRWGSPVPMVFISPFLKNRYNVSVFPVIRTFIWQSRLFKYQLFNEANVLSTNKVHSKGLKKTFFHSLVCLFQIVATIYFLPYLLLPIICITVLLFFSIYSIIFSALYSPGM